MLTSAVPPVTKTPLSAYLDESQLQKWTMAFNATKIKEVVGYELKKPKFEQAHLQDMVEKWKAEGSWPVVPDKS